MIQETSESKIKDISKIFFIKINSFLTCIFLALEFLKFLAM